MQLDLHLEWAVPWRWSSRAGNTPAPKVRLSLRRNCRSQYSKLQRLRVCTWRVNGWNSHNLAWGSFWEYCYIFIFWKYYIQNLNLLQRSIHKLCLALLPCLQAGGTEVLKKHCPFPSSVLLLVMWNTQKGNWGLANNTHPTGKSVLRRRLLQGWLRAFNVMKKKIVSGANTCGE